jgi:hypothetical protein
MSAAIKVGNDVRFKRPEASTGWVTYDDDPAVTDRPVQFEPFIANNFGLYKTVQGIIINVNEDNKYDISWNFSPTDNLRKSRDLYMVPETSYKEFIQKNVDGKYIEIIPENELKKPTAGFYTGQTDYKGYGRPPPPVGLYGPGGKNGPPYSGGRRKLRKSFRRKNKRSKKTRRVRY